MSAATCPPHSMRVVCGPGTISAQCRICKVWVAAMFAPEDDIERVLYVLNDQADQQMAPHTDINLPLARTMILARLSGVTLEAAGSFAPPAPGTQGEWAARTDVKLWRWSNQRLEEE